MFQANRLFFQVLRTGLKAEHRLALGVAALFAITLLGVVLVSSRGDATPLPARPVVAEAPAPVIPVIAASLPRAAPPLAAPAPPFHLPSERTQDRATALRCLTDAIYYEAALEPAEGQRAVAQVILNRVRDRAFPDTVCGVVYQGARAPGCQFSFACDGSLMREPLASLREDAARIAQEALDGAVSLEAGSATFYHADSIYPRWAPFLERVGQVGAHVFYRQPGPAGLASALRKAYAGGEADMAAILRASGGRPAAPFGAPGLQRIALTTGPPSALQPAFDPLVCHRRIPTAETRNLCQRRGARAATGSQGEMAALWRHARPDRAKFND